MLNGIRLGHSTDGYEFVVKAFDALQPDSAPEVGLAISYLTKLLDQPQAEAHICFPGVNDYVWVEPGFRNRGIGTAMLRYTGEIVRSILNVSTVKAFAVTSKQSLDFYVKTFKATILPASGENGQNRRISFPL